MFVLFLLSALGLVVSLGIHLYTFLPFSSELIVTSFDLYPIGLLFLVLVTVFHQKRDATPQKWFELLPSDTPRWMKWCLLLLSIYVLANFVFPIGHTIKVTDENYTGLVEAHIARNKMQGDRAGSAICMWFFFLPTSYFYTRWRRIAR